MNCKTHGLVSSIPIVFLFSTILTTALQGHATAHRFNQTPNIDSIDYLYTDNFETDKLKDDSYSHSSLYYYTPPFITLSGVLILWPLQASGTVCFYRGFDPGFYAHLNYQFPLQSNPYMVDSGLLSFDLAASGYSSCYLEVGVTYDNGSSQLLGVLTFGGSYAYELSPPDSCEYVQVSFVGEGVVMDNLSVTLNMVATGLFCGDVNSDLVVNVGDAVFLINYIFKSGSSPNPRCVGDANGDGNVNVADAVYLINHVFKSGPAPSSNCCP